MTSTSNNSFTKILNKYLPTSQTRKKFKRQCLKSKNILQQNQSIQIGCKIQKLYDFYSSKNFIQVNIFIGNKMNKPIERYNIEFKGTKNISVFLEEKEEKFIKQNTQGKERVVIEWITEEQNHNNQQQPSQDILLVMSFSSPVLTLKDTLIPLTLYSFYNFPLNMQKLIPTNVPVENLYRLFKEKYQLMEEQSFDLNLSLFKKGFNGRDMQKYLQKMLRLNTLQNAQFFSNNISTITNNNNRSQISSNQNQHNNQPLSLEFGGIFTIKTLLEEIGIIIQIKNNNTNNYNNGREEQSYRLKVTLCGNQYKYFEAVFQNLKFLFASGGNGR